MTTIKKGKTDGRMNLLYLFAERHPKNLRKLIRSRIPRKEFKVREMSYREPAKNQIKKMQWAEVALLAPGRHLHDDVLDAGKHLKLIQIWSSGYDKFNLAGATRAGIPVCNNGGANRIAVAEHTFLLMLAVYKRLPDSYRRVVAGDWTGNSHGMDMFILYRKTLALIGLGAIGKEVAVRAKVFGMRVLYYDIQRLSPTEEKRLGVEYARPARLYREADIVSLHLNYTPKAENMIGAREIRAMKKGVVVINVSRGELIDEEALLRALKNGRVGGVGFDAYRQEPTSPYDPLHAHPHFVGTPHMACTYDTHVMALDACVENLLRVKTGARPRFRVN